MYKYGLPVTPIPDQQVSPPPEKCRLNQPSDAPVYRRFPVIVEQKGTIDDREGCLSFPGLFAKVRRAKSVKVQAYNLKGELYEMNAADLAARVWQHEIDHLDGVLFIDHISKLKRDRVIKKFQKAAKRAGDGSHVL